MEAKQLVGLITEGDTELRLEGKVDITQATEEQRESSDREK